MGHTRRLRHLLPSASLLVAATLSLLAAYPALAGGWATVTLDRLPTEFRAGDTHRLGYTILQHGMTPFAGAATAIHARSAGGQTATFAARPEGSPGHYVAEVTFPTAGVWTWEVVPGSFAPQPLGSIAVAPADGARPAAPGGQALASPAPLAVPVTRAALAVGTLLAGAAFALQLADLRRRAVAGVATG